MVTLVTAKQGEIKAGSQVLEVDLLLLRTLQLDNNRLIGLDLPTGRTGDAVNSDQGGHGNL